MITMTTVDRLLTEHEARVERVNREGWKKWDAASRGGARRGGLTPVVARTRGALGLVLIRAGAWLQGTPAIHAADAATVG
jgi:hypothetical protein